MFINYKILLIVNSTKLGTIPVYESRKNFLENLEIFFSAFEGSPLYKKKIFFNWTHRLQ
jgi:hypothetical protein